MVDRDFIWRFTPSRTNPQTLENIFVQRQTLLADLVERVRESALTANKHYMLLVGPRGIGKTHLVALIRHRALEDKKLSNRLHVAWLNEDETTTSFLDFLVKICQTLSAAYSDEFPADGLQASLDADPNKAVRQVQEYLLNHLAKRTLLILVENADMLFRGLGDQGQKQLRAFLQEHPVACIVATSQQLFQGVQRRNSPFFGFFQIDHLQPMDLSEAVELLTKIATEHHDEALTHFLQSPEGRGRVRALHHLAGGNHRVYIVLTQFIDRESLDQLVGPFEKMIDELTPYYQERLRWLAPQQRRIVEILCKQTAPVPVKELAKQLFVKEQGVANQLKKLKELGYVVSHSRGRESLYELTEPLMRLSFEVKENGREPLRLIVDFLRIWYRPAQLREYEGRCEGRTKLHVQAALARLDAGDDPRMQVIQQAIDDAKAAGRLEEAILALEERAHSRGNGDDWFELAFHLDEVKRHQEALASYDNALAIEPDLAEAWINRGVVLADLGRREEALASFDRLLTIKPDNADAWYNRGVALESFGRNQDALESYGRALAIRPNDASVCYNRAVLLDGFGRHEEALDSYDKALAIKPDDFRSWNNRGAVLSNLGRYQEGLESFDKALAIKPDNADTWYNRVVVSGNLAQREEALASLDKALAIKPEFAEAWNYRGSILKFLGRHEEALGSCDKALAVKRDDPLILNNRGVILDGLGRRDEALASYDRALAAKPDFAPAAFNSAGTHFALSKWAEGFATLRNAFRMAGPKYTGACGDVAAMVACIANAGRNLEQWRQRIGELVDIYAEAGEFGYLSAGLVHSLAKIDAKMLSQEALFAWRDAWRDLGTQHAELEVALRIFDVGVRYLASNDPKVQFDLIETEREILKQALKLE